MKKISFYNIWICASMYHRGAYSIACKNVKQKFQQNDTITLFIPHLLCLMPLAWFVSYFGDQVFS